MSRQIRSPSFEQPASQIHNEKNSLFFSRQCSNYIRATTVLDFISGRESTSSFRIRWIDWYSVWRFMYWIFIIHCLVGENPSTEARSSDSNAGVIAGSVIAALAVILIIVIVAIYCRRKRKRGNWLRLWYRLRPFRFCFSFFFLLKMFNSVIDIDINFWNLHDYLVFTS